MITELNPEHFPCFCIHTENACRERASPKAACLLPDGQSIGGTEIWSDYYNYTHSNPPTPAPVPVCGTSFLQIYSAIISTVFMIYAWVSCTCCLLEAWRRRRYENLGTFQHAQTAGVPPSPDSPYAAQNQTA